MKTIDELYSEVSASEELRKEFLALKQDELADFAAAHDCKATLDEIKAYFAAKKNSGEMTDEELYQVTGGKKTPSPARGVYLDTSVRKPV